MAVVVGVVLVVEVGVVLGVGVVSHFCKSAPDLWRVS